MAADPQQRPWKAAAAPNGNGGAAGGDDDPAAEDAAPHAALFPYPGQGHINPMMQLAHRLLSDGFIVTFINTDFNHRRMLASGAISAHLRRWPPSRLRFGHLPDGLPPSHARLNENVIEFTAAILALPGPISALLRRLSPPPSVIIADAFCSWMQDVADALRVPRVALWTTPIHANLAYHFQSTLIDAGFSPLTPERRQLGLLDETVDCIPGIVPMKLKDYISFFLVENSTDFLFQWHLRLCMRRAEEAAWNLGNNWAELEPAAMAAFAAEVPNFLPIGPLLLPYGGGGAWAPLPPPNSSLDDADHCRRWLDQHPPASVLYISFGSIASLPREELAALVEGIRGGGAPFLWAVRPDQGGDALEELRAELKGSAELRRECCLVAWAPQTEVLSHPSVGGFLTHCGWNSVVEGLTAGVALLAKPGGFAEQQMNAHYVSEVWRVGLRLPDAAAAEVVAEHVRSLMSETEERAAVRRRVAEVRRSAEAAVGDGGSSAANYGRFLADIRRCVKASKSSLR